MSLNALVECPKCGGTAHRINYGPVIHGACGYDESKPLLEVAAILGFAFFGIPILAGLVVGFTLLFMWFWTTVLGWFGLQ